MSLGTTCYFIFHQQIVFFFSPYNQLVFAAKKVQLFHCFRSWVVPHNTAYNKSNSDEATVKVQGFYSMNNRKKEEIIRKNVNLLIKVISTLKKKKKKRQGVLSIQSVKLFYMLTPPPQKKSVTKAETILTQ